MQETEAITITLISITFFVTIACVIIALIIANFRRRKLEIETYKMAIEKGQSVPRLKIKHSPIGTLKIGLVFIAIGVGLFILIVTGNDTDGIGVCSIPILIGLALIISYYIEKKSEKAENNNSH